MEDTELKDTWKKYEQQIEEAKILNLQSWIVNLQTFEHLQTEKAKSKLNALSSRKKWIIFSGIGWVLFLVFLIYNSLEVSKIFFVVSIAVIALFNMYAIVIYIKQAILINEIDNSDSLLQTQQKIADLRLSTLNVPRILFLQTPFYSTFFWNIPWMTNDIFFWIIAFPVTLVLTWISIWLYKNISYKNAGKKWFKIIFSDKEWTSVIKATKYLNEIEEFKTERI